jgi:hypothetical protein
MASAIHPGGDVMSRRSKDFKDGFMAGWTYALNEFRPEELLDDEDLMYEERSLADAKRSVGIRRKPKRKKAKSGYNKFVAAKSKMSKFKYKTTRGNKKKGMVNMKAIGVAWRKLSAGQKKKWG